MIRTILKRADAHERLTERRCTRVHNDKIWINGYEYGLFMSPKEASLMGETLHINGFILEDVVSEFMYDLAFSYGHAENICCMETFVWNVQVLRGILRRPDAYILLLNENGINGYEYAVLHDEYLCKIIGNILRENKIPIYKVIRFSIFRQSFNENIKALFNT